MKLIPFILVVLFAFLCFQERKEHIAPAVNPRDSVSTMVTYGVNMLVSDSGMMKYRIVSECWEANQAKKPSRWIFEKGLFLEQFDPKFHVEAYIQCDTAYYFDQEKLWELRGRVRVKNIEGLRFSSEELFWDQNKHELYSNKYSKLVTPEREMEGTYFRSDERMTRYTITNSKGAFVKGGVVENEGDSILTAPDTVKAKKRLPTTPTARKTH